MKLHPALGLCVALTITGCGIAEKKPKWCTISAKLQKNQDESPVYYSLMFEDYQSSLMAKLLQCGEKDYIMSGYRMSKSTEALEAPQTEDSTKWNGILSCNDVQTAYSHDSQNSTDLLLHLCKLEELKAGQSEDSTQTSNEIPKKEVN